MKRKIHCFYHEYYDRNIAMKTLLTRNTFAKLSKLCNANKQSKNCMKNSDGFQALSQGKYRNRDNKME